MIAKTFAFSSSRSSSPTFFFFCLCYELCSVASVCCMSLTQDSGAGTTGLRASSSSSPHLVDLLFFLKSYLYWHWTSFPKLKVCISKSYSSVLLMSPGPSLRAQSLHLEPWLRYHSPGDRCEQWFFKIGRGIVESGALGRELCVWLWGSESLSSSESSDLWYCGRWNWEHLGFLQVAPFSSYMYVKYFFNLTF